jgi:hypothetical protein
MTVRATGEVSTNPVFMELRFKRESAVQTLGREIVVKPGFLHEGLTAIRAWPKPHSPYRISDTYHPGCDDDEKRIPGVARIVSGTEVVESRFTVSFFAGITGIH